jgi:hypothetical protein
MNRWPVSFSRIARKGESLPDATKVGNILISSDATKTTRINAIHEEHARTLLEELDVAESYDDGSLRCAVCGDSVRELGLGVARRRGEDVLFSCARLDCMREMS